MVRLICGRSRAGKTTYSKRYDNVIHLDAFGFRDKAYKGIHEHIATLDGDIVVDGIYDTPERRRALLDAYKGGGKRICIWLDTPLDVIESRFIYKPRTLPHPFDPPTIEEGWDEITIIRGENVESSNREK